MFFSLFPMFLAAYFAQSFGMRKQLIYLLTILIFACDSEQDKAGRFFIKGNTALTNGEYDEAIRFYSEAIAIDNQYKEALNNRGVAYYRERKYVEAINDYTQVLLQIDPEFIDARRNRVNAYLDAGRYEKALEDLDILQIAFPDSVFVDFTRGLVYHEMKDFTKSVEAFELALAKDEDNAEILINAANSYFMMKDYDQAVRLLEQAKMLDASEPNIYNTLAMISSYGTQPDYDQALGYINDALELDSDNAYFLNNRGFIHLMRGDWEKAEPDIRRAIIGAPENAWAYRNRGILLLNQGNYEGAVRNFERAETLEEGVPRMYFYWTLALTRLNKLEEACAVKDRSPEDFELTADLAKLPCK